MIRKLLQSRTWLQFSQFLRKRELLFSPKSKRVVEPLEDRVAPATLVWQGDLGGLLQDDWSAGLLGVNTNWDTNLIPLPGDTLIFPAGATFVGLLNNDTLLASSYILQFTG